MEQREQQLEKYEVTFRDTFTKNTWSIFVRAENYAHAEEQAVQMQDNTDVMIQITKEYE